MVECNAADRLQIEIEDRIDDSRADPLAGEIVEARAHRLRSANDGREIDDARDDGEPVATDGLGLIFDEIDHGTFILRQMPPGGYARTGRLRGRSVRQIGLALDGFRGGGQFETVSRKN